MDMGMHPGRRGVVLTVMSDVLEQSCHAALVVLQQLAQAHCLRHVLEHCTMVACQVEGLQELGGMTVRRHVAAITERSATVCVVVVAENVGGGTDGRGAFGDWA